MVRQKNKYTTIKIPEKLIETVDQFLEQHPEYTSRTDVIKEALRYHLRMHEH